MGQLESKQKLNLITCGLDNSGKTTILGQIKAGRSASGSSSKRAGGGGNGSDAPVVSATVGYNVETFEKGKAKFTVFDMAGAKKYRGMWETYYGDVDGVIFVIDSSDQLRLAIVREELETMLAHTELKKPVRKVGAKSGGPAGASLAPFLFFANKMDVPGSKTAQELVDALMLTELVGDRPFNIFPSNALTGEGIEEGFQWLQKTLGAAPTDSGKKK